MDKEYLTLPIGAELDATIERLCGLFGKDREELVAMLLEEAVFAVEDTYDRSGQIWDSVRFDYVMGGRRALKRADRDEAIEDFLRRASEFEAE